MKSAPLITALLLSCLLTVVIGQSIAPAMDANVIWPPAFDPTLLGSNDGCSTSPLVGKYRTFNVGPGQTYTELTSVPWLSLQGGDVVNIYYRSAPYKNWIPYRAVANATHPVTINGVTDANCNRPIISGSGASPTTDAKAVNWGSAIEGVGVVVIWKSPSEPSDHMPMYLSLRNLELSGAKQGNNYTALDGTTKYYDQFVAGIYAVRIQHLLVHNCLIQKNGIGIFTNSKGQFDGDYSSYLTIRASKLVDSGYSTSSTEHNLYLQARRVLVEGSYIGQANGGSSFKDRSSGTVARYNFILASARALDFVETEEEYYDGVRADPLYQHSFVYGNVILNDANMASSSGRPFHWGFDNNSAKGRFGTMYFYGNTYVYRTVSGAYYVNVFQLGNDYAPTTSNFTVTSWDNIFINQNTLDTTTEYRFLTDNGRVVFKGNNYLPTGWVHVYGGTGVMETFSADAPNSKVIVGPASAIDPTNFMPDIGSPLIGNGNSFTPDFTTIESENSDFRKENLARIGEYYVGSSSSIAGARLKTDSTLNIGAF